VLGVCGGEGKAGGDVGVGVGRWVVGGGWWCGAERGGGLGVV